MTDAPNFNRAANRSLTKRFAAIILTVAALPVIVLGWLVFEYWRSLNVQPNPGFLQVAILLLGAAALLAVVGAWLAALFISAPLTKLAGVMRGILAGGLDQRMPSTGEPGMDEITGLFNQIADEYRSNYQSLTLRDSRVRGGQDQTLSQIAVLAVASRTSTDLLPAALETIGRDFSCLYSALYLLEWDELHQNRFAALQHAYQHNSFDTAALGVRAGERRINLETASSLDWLVRRVLDTAEALIAKVTGEPGLVEAAIPLELRGQTVGILSLFAQNRSTDPHNTPFSPRQLAELGKIANLIALTLQTFPTQPALASRSFASATAATKLQTLPVEGKAAQKHAMLLYQASSWITQAETEEGALVSARQALEQIPFPAAILTAPAVDQPGLMRVICRTDQPQSAPENAQSIALEAQQLAPHFQQSVPQMAGDLSASNLPQPLLEIPRQMGCDAAVYIPVLRGGLVRTLLILGRPAAQDGKTIHLPVSLLSPYLNLIELLTSTLERIRSQSHVQRQLTELRTFWNVSQAIALETDLSPIFRTIHHQAEGVLGELSSFTIALFDAQSDTVRIPYLSEEGRQLNIAPFKLGDDLVSLLIRTERPLLLDEDLKTKSLSFGNKIQDQPVKCWLGTPMLYGGDVVGAIIVQEFQKEKRFNEGDLRLLNALAAQLALVVHNARLLEDTRRQAQQERLVNEITARIRRSPDIKTILQTTATELGTVLGAHKAHIRIDLEQEPLPPGKGGG